MCSLQSLGELEKRQIMNMPRTAPNEDTNTSAFLYLDLLKKRLVRWGEDTLVPLKETVSFSGRFARGLLQRLLAKERLEVFRRDPFNADVRENGRDWPVDAETMIGLKRLNNLQYCIEAVLCENIPGDLVETGIWRGGACIFMRAVLAAFLDEERVVWCADSFRGLPAPDLDKYPQDSDVIWHTQSQLMISLEEVKNNFRKYGLLGDRVQFLVGWFKDTLPNAPIKRISVLRLDGDMYESTMDALDALYEKVSPGGFIIVDDYGIPEDTCRRAVHDYREAKGIEDPIIDIDEWGVYWRRPV